MMIGGVSTAALAGAGFSLTSSDLVSGIEETVRRAFPDLRMASHDLRAFSVRMARFLDYEAKKELAVSVLLDHPVGKIAGDTLVDQRVRRAEGKIVARFLRSTDMLDPDRQGEEISLIGFADPYEAGCSNPVAQWTSHEVEWPQEALGSERT
ncbi:hypothetical protein [Croceicoccus gelatinilyticus]|uniref:hypothetical protein n=1 Tax=Croceicoccus gelatinilyticus TaxID=2835536 RepID=UPI001BCFCFF5|nr:hypothetical protein [Croceicoccus gelatinilyticus]MBS7671572.1 hypothetical protein [Croceicoccus gelatinilyticus]